ncbi:MAG: hypothetical protein OEY85_06570, partial [Rhodospirillales bacterium]|nr:hypothetical protein [Rhodospirillales bacterium]
GVFMKRFGWSRPALLIGFVLSEQLEASFYRTIQVYAFDFLMRPISFSLLVLSVISAYVAWRNTRMIEKRKQAAEGEPESKDSLSRSQRLPQIIFALSMAAFLLVNIVDVSKLRFLSNAFPLTIAGITSVLFLIIIVNMFRAKPPARLMCDAELEISAGTRGSFYYFSWLLGLIGLSWLIGFAFAVPLFVFIFLRYLAGTGIRATMIGVVFISGLLTLMSRLLVLEYPQGLLQSYVNIPWNVW